MTKHKIILTIKIILIFALLFGIGLYLLISTGMIELPGYTGEEADKKFSIKRYVSKTDKDGDGKDDSSDILQAALDYVAKKPVYESKYYAGGYPDDGYGVCTDVVAFALRDAGYDLMELVSEDIKNAPEAYNIENPDKNIDFRRVVNLDVYFKRHAESLTLDVSEIAEWQPGDIVVFEGHIGIISDTRNFKGIPYVIHHGSVTQKSYVQDILEKNRNHIIGHYRIS